jgi:hypothetical protein
VRTALRSDVAYLALIVSRSSGCEWEGWTWSPVTVLIAGVNDYGFDSRGDTEAWNVLPESNMNRGGDAARDIIVFILLWSVRWITDRDAAACLFA